MLGFLQFSSYSITIHSKGYPVVSTPGLFDTRSFRHFLVISTPKKFFLQKLVVSTPVWSFRPPKKIFCKNWTTPVHFFALPRIIEYYFVLTYIRVCVYFLLFYYCSWTIILLDTTVEMHLWRVAIEEYRNVLFVSDNSNNHLFLSFDVFSCWLKK